MVMNPEQNPTTIEEWLRLPTGQTSSSVMECLDPTSSVFHEDYWTEGTRRDGRLLSQLRQTKVVYGVVKKHSNGSAIVSHGSNETKVLAATTMQVGQPSPQAPDRGDIVVRLTVNSGASGNGGGGGGSDLKSFQQQQHADVLQSWLQRTMEEDFGGGNNNGGGGGGGRSNNNKSIPSCLSLSPGKACLRLVVTVVVLEDGGSLKDVCLLACMAAWKDTRLPVLGQDLKEVNGKLCWTNSNVAPNLSDKSVFKDGHSDRMMVDDNDENDSSRWKDQRKFRISLTMGVWVHPTKGTLFILDPSTREEACFDGNELTVTTEIGNEDNLQVDYAGRIPLTAKDVALVAKLAKARGDEVSDLLLT
jgi:exosome complex RNA-binding protein Rrp42 (RNase PH superfamily)